MSVDHIVFSKYLHSGVNVKKHNNGSLKKGSYMSTFTNYSRTFACFLSCVKMRGTIECRCFQVLVFCC